MTNALHGSGFLTSSVTVSRCARHRHVQRRRARHRPDARHLRRRRSHPGRNDTFIINDNFGINGATSNSFTLGFTNFTISALSFDRPIFPDATCQKGSYCAGHPGSSNDPDIELDVDGVLVWSMLASTPANGDPQALGLSNLTDLAACVGVGRARIGGAVRG